MSETIVSITLLDKTYPIKCLPAQKQELLAAADYLNAQFNKLLSTSKSNKLNEAGLMVTALNISHELIQTKNKLDQQVSHDSPQLQRLIEKLEDFLAVQHESLV